MRSKKDMMCSCGKRKGECNCKGYAYGSNKVKGYYDGSLYAEATPQQEQEMMAMAPGVRIEAAGPTADFGQPSELTQQTANVAQQAVTKGVKDEIGGAIGEKITGHATEEAAKTALEEAGKKGLMAGATEGAKQGLATGLTGAVGGAAGSLVGDVVSGKGITKEGAGKALLQAGLTAAMGPVGGIIGGLFAKDGTPSVPPMGYNYGTPEVKEKEKEEFEAKRPVITTVAKPQQQGGMSLEGMAEQGLLGFIPKFVADDEFRKDTVDFAKKGGIAGALLGFADGTAKMTPEEYQMKFIKERILAPAEAYVEERPMLQAPLLLASAARDYERGELPLGKFGGGKLEGGKDRIAYRHKKYGDFEINPESERVSYKKTFRF
ncbi:hypothetical protein N8457_00105 [bacterium]|nr:hypothetical protein [bacterium]